MATKKISFEENLENLEKIVTELEQGDVPLEKALAEFQKGIALSQQLEKTLANAEETLAKVMTDTNQEVTFQETPADTEA